MKTTLVHFTKQLFEAHPTILLSLFLFYSIKAMGASENIILAFILPYYFLSAKTHKINMKSFVTDVVIFTLLGLLSNLASSHSICMVLLNLLVPFGIVFFLCDEYNLGNYTLYGVIFTYFQRYALPLDKMITRVFVFAYAFAITFVAICINLKLDKQKNGIFEASLSGRERKIRVFDLNAPHTRVALRLGIIMLFSSVITRFLKPYIPKSEWFFLHTFLLMRPSYEDSITRICQRAKGTLLGAAVVSLIVCVLGWDLPSVLVCIVTFSGMYMAKRYDIRSIVSTSLALLLTVRPGDGYLLILVRIGAVLAAGVVVYLGNRFIFPVYNKKS